MNVRWTRLALDQLAAIYVTLPLDEQQVLAARVEWVNARLIFDPTNLGESRDRGTRLWFAGPLAILFRVNPSGTVEVLEFGWYNPAADCHHFFTPHERPVRVPPPAVSERGRSPFHTYRQ